MLYAFVWYGAGKIKTFELNLLKPSIITRFCTLVRCCTHSDWLTDILYVWGVVVCNTDNSFFVIQFSVLSSSKLKFFVTGDINVKEFLTLQPNFKSEA